MDWFVNDPQRGQTALTVIVAAVAAISIWFGRKKLLITIPLVLVFVLLAALAIPSAIPARSSSQRIACISNLRAVQDAKREWAAANHKVAAEIPTAAELYSSFIGRLPKCPGGGVYSVGSVSQNPTCTLSNLGHRMD